MCQAQQVAEKADHQNCAGVDQKSEVDRADFQIRNLHHGGGIFRIGGGRAVDIQKRGFVDAKPVVPKVHKA